MLLYYITGVSYPALLMNMENLKYKPAKSKNMTNKKKKYIIEKYICITTIIKGHILRYYKNAPKKIRLKKAYEKSRVCQKIL